MKTKYILHGGYATTVNGENNKFFQEILKSDKKELNILLVLFAQKEEDYPLKAEKVKCQFGINKKEKIINFKTAKSELFSEQLKWADVIYLYGGENLKLLNALKENTHFPELIKGKVVAGESAGAYVLSAYFYSKTLKSCFAGLNLVPVKTICHFVGENRDKLKDCPADLEELLLPEYQYKVFEI